MKRTFEIGTGTFGSGRPKICVPIVAQERDSIWEKAREASALDIDVAEWRADFFADIADEAAVEEVLRGLKTRLGKKALLFTFRTAREGGERSIGKKEYAKLLRHAASGAADLIDVEAFWDSGFIAPLIGELRGSGVKVIASNHDFKETPPVDEMLRRLHFMEKLGADAAKLAVMPLVRQDVLNLMEASLLADSQLQIPVITMSMGRLGMISRLAGSLTGSAMTFASLGTASAPGQMDAAKLIEIMKTEK